MTTSREEIREQLESLGYSEQQVLVAAHAMETSNTTNTNNTIIAASFFDPTHFLVCVLGHLAGGDSLSVAVDKCHKHIDEP